MNKLKKFFLLSFSTIVVISIFSCNVNLTEVVDTVQNPEPTKIASVVEKTVKSIENNSKQSTSSELFSFQQGVSLYSKVKDKLKKTPYYSDNFDSYGIGQLPPYGKWIGTAPIKTIVSADKKITKTVSLQNRFVCLKPKFKDFYLSFNILGKGWWDVSITFRKIKNPNVSYIAKLGHSKFILQKSADNNQFEIAKNSFDISKRNWHFAELYVNGSHIVMYVDYSVAFDLKDEDQMMQQVGEICISGWNPTYMDNFRIFKISKTE